MRDTPLHPQKPVLVEHVTDDIRRIQTTTNIQQKTIVTARALADMLAGDRFKYDANDKYCENHFFDAAELTNGNYIIDLNKVTVASIKFTDAAKYIHGPDDIGHSAFIHTAAVLPTGELSFDTNGDSIRSNDATMRVRQIIYPTSHLDFEPFTRVGTTTDSGATWMWSRWLPLSGKLIRILVTTGNADNLLNTPVLRTGVIYELHCGGRIITLPDADSLPAGETVIFEQYANGEALYINAGITTTMVNGVLTISSGQPPPSPIARYFVHTANGYIPAGSKHGWLTEFTADLLNSSDDNKFYLQQAAAAWSNRVTYTEKVTSDEERTYVTEVIPGMDTLRTSQSDISDSEWYSNSEQAVQYVYEVVDRESTLTFSDSTTSSRTWQLCIDPEATARMADMAELLDAHTDRALSDIIAYNQRKFRKAVGDTVTADDVDDSNDYFPRNNEPLVITKLVSMAGYAKVKIIGNANDATWYNHLNGMHIRIYRYNDKSSAFTGGTGFTYTEDIGTVPNPYKQYYTFDGTRYSLTGANGYLGEFTYTQVKETTPISTKPYYTRVNNVYTRHYGLTVFVAGTTYYERPSYYTRTINISKLPDLATMTYAGAAEQPTTEFDFSGTDSPDVTFNHTFWTTHNEVVGYIKCDRNDTLMIVIDKGDNASFRHRSARASITPSVEYYPDAHDSYVQKINVNTTAITNTELNKVPCPEQPSDMVAGAGALTRAYELLATTLQNKGLLFGSQVITGATDLNSKTTTGIYDLNGIAAVNRPVEYISGSTKSASAATNDALVVIDSKSQATNSDHATAGKDLIGQGVNTSDTATHRVCQLYVSNNAASQLWIRTGCKTGAAAYVWTPWSKMMCAPTVVERYGIATILATDVSTYLSRGNACICVGYNTQQGSAPTITVNLPDPAAFPNARLQIEAKYTKTTIQYNKAGTDYIFADTDHIRPSTGDSPDSRMLYPLESDGVRWFIVTVN